jgi:hypothetical protein
MNGGMNCIAETRPRLSAALHFDHGLACLFDSTEFESWDKR